MTLRNYVVIGLTLIALLAAIPLAVAQESNGRICVTAYYDADQNGTRGPLEPLLANIVVTLQNEQAVSVGNYITDGQSEPYCFDGLAAGTYFVSFSGGMMSPTGESDFAVTLNPGGIPAQVQYGAIDEGAAASAPAQAAAPSTSTSLDQTTLLRIVFAVAGAVLVMVGLAIVGVVIYWLRFRRA
ncbi:MAG: hypothetical protein Kow0077_19650 [Anaerolineae bacterium]